MTKNSNYEEREHSLGEEEMERKARDNEKMRGTDKQNNPRNSIAIYEDGRGMEGWHRTGTQDK